MRTLDAGADKPLAFLPAAAEDNPFLGVRGIRLGLRHPELLDRQLRAVLRVAADHPLRLLLPMVTTRRRAAARARARSTRRAPPRGAPAAQRRAPRARHHDRGAGGGAHGRGLAPHVDFFSLGTNDLTQYALAAERGNAAVAALATRCTRPCCACRHRERRRARAGRPLAVCGEVAGDPAAVPLLLGLGVTELSHGAGADRRWPSRRCAPSSCAPAAAGRAALAAASAAEVRRLVAR